MRAQNPTATELKVTGVSQTVRRMLAALTPQLRRRMLWMAPMGVLGGLAELVSIGAVVPFFYAIVEPAQILSFPVLGDVLAAVGVDGPDQVLWPMTAMFVAVLLLAGLARFGLLFLSTRLAYDAGLEIGQRAFARAISRPYLAQVQSNSAGVLASITNVNNVVYQMIAPLLNGVTGAVVAVFVVLGLVLVEWRIAAMATLTVGGSYLIISFAVKAIDRRLRSRMAVGLRRRVEIVQESLGGIRDVILDQSQQAYSEKFNHNEKLLRRAENASLLASSSPRLMVETAAMLAIIGIAVITAQSPSGLTAAMPTLAALALGAQRLLPSMQLAFVGWSQTLTAKSYVDKILDLIELPDEIAKPASSIEPIAFKSSIRIDGVSFRYSGQAAPAIDAVSFEIPKGSRVAFVGRTGSGKSTMMDLLLGLLPPSQGAILIDGVALDASTIPSWQRNIAHVPQSIFLTDASVAENIAFGADAAAIDMDRVRAAARMARIADFIEAQPEGYGMPVGERGVRLSGGQRQRIGIARALYKNASVLVFDEATSALDTGTEASVMEAIEALSSELTVIMITHRMSTARFCDSVLRFEDGKLAEIYGPGKIAELASQAPA
jgi:ATP-binding cassette, subfamily B, bacterial PglK